VKVGRIRAFFCLSVPALNPSLGQRNHEDRPKTILKALNIRA